MNFVDYLLENPKDPGKQFILGDHGTLSYGEFLGKLQSLSSVLSSRYGSGKNILLMADNTPFFIIGYFSILNSGNIALLVETRIGRADLVRICETGTPAGALVQKKYRPLFADMSFGV